MIVRYITLTWRGKQLKKLTGTGENSMPWREQQLFLVKQAITRGIGIDFDAMEIAEKERFIPALHL
jgi:hypothetical protein